MAHEYWIGRQHSIYVLYMITPIKYTYKCTHTHWHMHVHQTYSRTAHAKCADRANRQVKRVFSKRKRENREITEWSSYDSRMKLYTYINTLTRPWMNVDVKYEFHVHNYIYIHKFDDDDNNAARVFIRRTHTHAEARAQTTTRIELEEHREEWICVCVYACEAENILCRCYFMESLSVFHSSVAMFLLTTSNVASGPTSQPAIQLQWW